MPRMTRTTRETPRCLNVLMFEFDLNALRRLCARVFVTRPLPCTAHACCHAHALAVTHTRSCFLLCEQVHCSCGVLGPLRLLDEERHPAPRHALLLKLEVRDRGTRRTSFITRPLSHVLYHTSFITHPFITRHSPQVQRLESARSRAVRLRSDHGRSPAVVGPAQGCRPAHCSGAASMCRVRLQARNALVSHVTRHASHVTRHTSHVTRSHVPPPPSSCPPTSTPSSSTPPPTQSATPQVAPKP